MPSSNVQIESSVHISSFSLPTNPSLVISSITDPVQSYTHQLPASCAAFCLLPAAADSVSFAPHPSLLLLPPFVFPQSLSACNTPADCIRMLHKAFLSLLLFDCLATLLATKIFFKIY